MELPGRAGVGVLVDLDQLGLRHEAGGGGRNLEMGEKETVGVVSSSNNGFFLAKCMGLRLDTKLY